MEPFRVRRFFPTELEIFRHGATGQETVKEKKFFKVRELSGNFILGQEKLAFEEKSGKIEIVRLIYSAKGAIVSSKPRFLTNF